MLPELIFNVLLNNVTDARTHDIASPWAPVGAKKCCQNRNYIYDYDKYIYFTNNLMVILIIKYKRITHDDINKEQVNIHI